MPICALSVHAIWLTKWGMSREEAPATRVSCFCRMPSSMIADKLSTCCRLA